MRWRNEAGLSQGRIHFIFGPAVREELAGAVGTYICGPPGTPPTEGISSSGGSGASTTRTFTLPSSLGRAPRNP